MRNLIAALDQGTSRSKCVLFDDELNLVRYSQAEVPLILGPNGEIEQSPADILDSALTVLRNITSSLGSGEKIEKIGITNQRETFLLWDRDTGMPLHNAILWEDRRTDALCADLRKKYGAFIKERTGLIPDAYFSASKIRWLLDRNPDLMAMAKKGKIACGTVDSWLLWNLTGRKVHATDHTNASRTMLFNIDRLDWDSELLAIMGIPSEILPELHESCYEYGETSAEILGSEIPLTALIGDQQSSMFGHFLGKNGDTKITYGSGAFLMQSTGEHRVKAERLLETVLVSRRGERSYALEGPVFWAGKLLDFLASLSGSSVAKPESADPMRIFRNFPPSILVPSIEGIGAPYWQNIAGGSIFGLRAKSRTQDLMDSALASIALQVNDIIEELNSMGRKPDEIMVDGGLALNRSLMDFQSSVSGISLKTGSEPHIVTARGAASLASGFTGNRELKGTSYKAVLSSSTDRKIKSLIRLWKMSVSLAIQFNNAALDADMGNL